MKYTVFKYDGNSYRLLFNGNAKFDTDEIVGDNLFEKIMPSTKENKEILCKVAAIMMEQANLCRKYEGYEPDQCLDAEALNIKLSPIELANLYSACATAILRGYGREVTDEKNEIDLGLLELEGKKKH